MSTAPSRPASTPRLSARLITLMGALFALGVAQGALVYLQRSPVLEAQVADTDGWAVHAVLAVVVAVVALAVAIRRRRLGRRGSALLLPVGEKAARRVRLTVRQRPRPWWRLGAAVLPTILLLYGPIRAGEQIIAGLDPNFTVNAWGGPGYLGAMACHYLDTLVMMAVAAWLLDRILLPDRACTAADRSVD
ncbi:hypothetical protein [Gordonia phthalatica]|nr:hypothetical protein [Gordonia phthalatica]